MSKIAKDRVVITRDDFGVLKSVQRDNRDSLWINSTSGHKLEMTAKFPEINSVEAKAKQLVGKAVRVFTSQVNADWSSLRYFCDLEFLNKENELSGDDFWQEISGEDGYVCDGYNIND